MPEDHYCGADTLTPSERRRLEELWRRLEADDPELTAALRHGRVRSPSSTPLVVVTAIAVTVLLLAAVLIFGGAVVTGFGCAALTVHALWRVFDRSGLIRRDRPERGTQ